MEALEQKEFPNEKGLTCSITFVHAHFYIENLIDDDECRENSSPSNCISYSIVAKKLFIVKLRMESKFILHLYCKFYIH